MKKNTFQLVLLLMGILLLNCLMVNLADQDDAKSEAAIAQYTITHQSLTLAIDNTEQEHAAAALLNAITDLPTTPAPTTRSRK